MRQTPMLKGILFGEHETALELLHKRVGVSFPEVDLLDAFTLPSALASAVNQMQPDLVFADIQSKEKLEQVWAATLKHIGSLQLIYMTPSDVYGLGVVPYYELLERSKKLKYKNKPKPSDKVREQQYYLRKIEHLLDQKNQKQERQKIILPTKDGAFFLTEDQIVKLEGSASGTYVSTSEGEQLFTNKRLIDLQKYLDAQRFRHVHRSKVVNVDYVQKYVSKSGGYLVMYDESVIEISRRKKADWDLGFRK